MNKLNKFFIWTLVSVFALGFIACDDDDDLDTNQYTKGEVSLNVYGPVPVVRGGTLRFLGSNLEQVSQVIIPGVDAITDITVVSSGVPSEIRVQVPVDGPEEGYVQLVTSSGKTITTETELYYTETIVFDSFSPAEVMAGDELTIEGDYLNLIEEVIFTDNVIVKAENFTSQDRYTITVTVPDEAQTGEIILADGDSEDTENLANLIYSDDELVVGTPTITSFTTDTRFKAGETLTITGTYLNLANYVTFEGAEVPSADLAEDGDEYFTVNDEGTTITLAQPTAAASGEVKLVLKSEVEVTVATEDEFQVVTPSELAVASETVKAGLSLVIAGADLDLVTSVTFPTDVDGGDFTIDGTTSITIAAIPTTATDGDITLGMANGMSSTVAYTLVKPTVTAYSSTSPSAGSSITITGTDLDLVTSVSFGGGSEATPDSQTETELTVTIPMDSGSGTVTLTLGNGTTVDGGELTVEEATFCYVTEWPEGTPDAGTLLTVTVANADVLTSVEVNGSTVQYVLQDPTLYIALPETAGSGTSIRLISSTGEITYTIDVTPNTEVTTTIWSGAYDVGNWGGFTDLSWGGYDWSTVSAGTVLTVYYTLDESYTWWQMRVANGSWAALPGTEDPYDLSGTTSLSVTLTDDMLTELVNNGGLVLTGCYYIISKITLTVYTDLATTVWEGSYDVGGWGGFSELSWGGYDWSVLQSGMVLTAYYTLDTNYTYWQMRFGNGSWAALPGTDDVINLEEGSTSYSIDVTDDVIDELVNNGGLVMTGCYYILTKITYQ